MASASSSSISFSCSLFSTKPINDSSSSTSPRLLSSRFLGARNLKLRIRPNKLGPSNGSRTTCWFKFAAKSTQIQYVNMKSSDELLYKFVDPDVAEAKAITNSRERALTIGLVEKKRLLLAPSG